MITNIFSNPKFQVIVGTIVVAASIWAKISAVAMPIFPIIGIIFGSLLELWGLYGLQRLQDTTHRPFSNTQVIQNRNSSEDPLLILAKNLI
ncbi:MAG: hypothetical protein HZB76_01070 [Chlamydiae bacterium]|nr:hypothetical protein [Chlamydiota bacterium]